MSRADTDESKGLRMLTGKSRYLMLVIIRSTKDDITLVLNNKLTKNQVE